MHQMEKARSHKGIRSRERSILGTVSFLPPVVPGKEATSTTPSSADNDQDPKDQSTKKRRAQVLQAQRTHRKRTKDYMSALEEEVLRLRSENASLNQAADDWKKCVVAVVGPSEETSSSHSRALAFDPASFLWVLSDAAMGDFGGFGPQQHLAEIHSLHNLSFEHIGEQELCLLENFCENIVPTLDLTETSSNGYARHIIPLALGSKMVMNALLAASASHVQKSRAICTTAARLKYRSDAISELHQAASRPRSDPIVSLLALATILGLLIDDIINCNQDFPILLRLSDFWVRSGYPHGEESSEWLTYRFLLDQMQIIKALVYPLYEFRSLAVMEGSQPANIKMLLSYNRKDLYQIFSSIEGAMAQACEIYSLEPTTRAVGSPSAASSSHVQRLNALIGKLMETVHDLPPFAPGEDSLVWIYVVAASRAMQSDHKAFFSARLAELLRRLGHDDVKRVLSDTVITEL